MNKSLVIRCSRCKRVVESLDPKQRESSALGEAVRKAAEDGQQIELVDGSIEIGCSCDEGDEFSFSLESLRINLKQMLLIITASGIVLAIFRRPILMMFDEQRQQWAAAPWSFYGWLFFGTELIDPKAGGGKDPLGILLFALSLGLALLLPFCIFMVASETFKQLWQMARSERNHGAERDGKDSRPPQ